MKIMLRGFGVLLGVGFLLVAIDQVFFQILGEARLLVTLSWFLTGGMFLAYGILGKEPKELIRAIRRGRTKRSEGEP